MTDMKTLRETLRRVPDWVASTLDVRRRHFSEELDAKTMERSGLLYIAKHIGPHSVHLAGREGIATKVMKIPDYTRGETPGTFELTETKESWKDREFRRFPVTKTIEEGSKEYFKKFVADMYIGSTCGCAVETLDTLKEKLPLELLSHGHVFYAVRAVDHCGKKFQKLIPGATGGYDYSRLPGIASRSVDELIRMGQEERMKEFFELPMGTKVDRLSSSLAAKLDVPKGLQRRLHVIPVTYGVGEIA